MIIQRDINTATEQALLQVGYSPLEARLLAARHITSVSEAQLKLSLLPYPNLFKNMSEVVQLLAHAIINGKKIIVAGDYDADGATSCVVAIKSVKAMGGIIDFVVPDREKDGYGLSYSLVDQAISKNADIIMTVDNGISALASVAYAQSKGITVIVTDHHLPAEKLPDCLIINPNQPGCLFPSKNLAGVGVVFYVMSGIRSQLELLGYFKQHTKPNLTQLLDLVALGTVADVVKLDHVNRILVYYGLKLIQDKKNCVGIQAIIDIAGKKNEAIKTCHLGFVLGPRINASGRLDNITTSILCLLSEHYQEAYEYAKQLNDLNQKRKKRQVSMLQIAEEDLALELMSDQKSIVNYSEQFHQGVIGIVAGLLKDKYYLPTIVFAKGEHEELKGSGRSIPGLHLRDTLDFIAKNYHGLIIKFGGHAMAAGLSIHSSQLNKFKQVFETTLQEKLSLDLLNKVFLTDGPLQTSELNLQTVKLLDNMIWGQGFEEPKFCNFFEVEQQQLVGAQQNHLKIILKKDNQLFRAMLFNFPDHLPRHVNLVYRLVLNEYNQTEELQLYVDYWEKAAIEKSLDDKFQDAL